MEGRSLTDDKPGHVRTLRLPIFVVDAVVADQRIRHHHVLARVGRIGEDLLIPGHGSIEDDLPQRGPWSPETVAVEAATVLQEKVRGVRLGNASHQSE